MAKRAPTSVPGPAPDRSSSGASAAPRLVLLAGKESFLRSAYTDEIAQALRARGIEAQGLLVMGSVVDKTLEQARRLHAEMILMGSHGHSAIYDLLVGSATESVLRHADRPVLVVPARGR